jgi:DNA-directed RNA polymerase specialized sigma24 family protein
VTEADQLFLGIRGGNRYAFAQWLSMVEAPLRRSLHRYARDLDTEVILQETLTRMWMIGARGKDLEGENASLLLAFGVMRNVRREEERRLRLAGQRDGGRPEDHPDAATYNPELPDAGLRRAIARCFEKLPGRPRKAMKARLKGSTPDRDLAEGLGMKLNTFLQNIVRARKSLARCLEESGVRLAEYLP